MNKEAAPLEAEYLATLTAFLAGAGEVGLQRGYELGRDALESKLNLLQVVDSHLVALIEVLSPISIESARTVNAAREFFAASLAPFEMIQRGYQDTVAKLKALNEMLENSNYKTTDDLRIANATLQQRAIDLERAMRAKSEFLANMSHEIRTPLNAMLGMTGILIDSGLHSQQLENANVIQSSGETLLNLINDILDFSKVEAGKLEFDDLDFNFASILRHVHHTFDLSAKKKNLQFTLEIAKNIPPYLSGDPTRVCQVVANLLSNAIKFTVVGRVQLNVVLQSLVENQAQVRFEIEDSGIGIGPVTLTKLFAPFTQADSSPTRKNGGTGLGLSISKKLVEHMGGEIGVTSLLGKGSTFWFTLPFKVTANVNPELALPVTHPWRALLAEDNPVNQKIAKTLLEHFGLTVDVVANGLEALKALRQCPYDLVFMDCQMPEMDGYNATKEIRKDKTTTFHAIPILAITANAISGDRERCLAVGMNDYLTKPINKKALGLVIQKWTTNLRSRAA